MTWPTTSNEIRARWCAAATSPGTIDEAAEQGLVRDDAARRGVLFAAGAGAGQLPVLRPDADFEGAGAGAPLTLGAAASGPLLGVGPVILPDYLKRREIVTRAGPNRLDLSPRDLWAEPLADNFTSVLAQNLGILLGAHRVLIYPWDRPANLDYQIAVTVTRFDTDAKGNAQLTAAWEIRDPSSGDALASGNADINTPAQSGESAAATLSRALGDLSRQLADAVRSAPARPAPSRAKD